MEIEVAPPPAPGSRVQELGDQLIVRFRAHRSWGTIAFLTFWLTFWTWAGIFAFVALPDAGWGERAFLFVWLCGWLVGECGAGVAILWQLFGREVLTITPEDLEVRREIERFARTTRYDTALVHDIQAARALGDEDEKPRKDFCLAVSYDKLTVRIGEGMGEREAEWVASTVLTRIRPRTRWSDERRADLHIANDPQASAPRRLPSAALAGTLVVVVVGVVAATVVLLHHDEPPSKAVHAPSAQTPAAPSRHLKTSPSARAFADPQAYASAMTLYALTSSRTSVSGPIRCGGRVTWKAWRCTVTAQATMGPLAGNTMTYRCYAVAGPQLGQGVVCGPANPPSITG